MSAKKQKTAKTGAKTIVIQQIGSPLRRPYAQELYLKSLGLGKMNRTRELTATPNVLGLIKKVQHMVKVISE